MAKKNRCGVGNNRTLASSPVGPLSGGRSTVAAARPNRGVTSGIVAPATVTALVTSALLTSALATSALFLAGCSSIFSGGELDMSPSRSALGVTFNALGEPRSTDGWLTDGVVAISRPAPAASAAFSLTQAQVSPGEESLRSLNSGGLLSSNNASDPAPLLDSTTLLGFMPMPPTQAALWLSIDTRAMKISLMRGTAEVADIKGEGVAELTKGVYSVVHKQSNPRWYAPDSYFTRRGLPIPPEGDRARLRRGALGDHAIFLDKDTPIHTGPLWSSEVGGVKLEPGDFNRIFEQLEVGSKVEVK